MNNFYLALFLLACFSTWEVIQAQNNIEVKGRVKFLDNRKEFKITALQREGIKKKVLAESIVNPSELTYQLSFTIDKPGEVEINCGQWQSVNIWAEDEDLNIDFRGSDTAKVKIKKNPYVYINGGKKNEIMNFINWESYRNYQNMIAISQNVYHTPINDEAEKQKLARWLYDANSEDFSARMLYYIQHYANRSSVLAAIRRLNPDKYKKEINIALTTLAQTCPQLVADYRKKAARDKNMRERMSPGRPLPNFEAQLVEKHKKVSPADYKGKVLVLDFWASWCGPCRQEIPSLKKCHEAFEGQDVAFLSISIDTKQANWKKAMKEENMPWDQAIVPNGGKEIMELYQFSSIPFIIIIDKEGDIYAKNVRGEKIIQAIQEVLDGKKAPARKTVKTIGSTMMGTAM